jgi:ComF family protein
MQRIDGLSEVYSIFEYKDEIRDIIRLLKFNGVKSLGSVLGALVSPDTMPDADLIVPVPIHAARRRKRGFNQVDLIFSSVASPQIARRIKNTEPLFEQSLSERKKTLQNAFEVTSDVQGKRILILDDIVTTGSTLSELAGALRKKGAADVRAFTVSYAA